MLLTLDINMEKNNIVVTISTIVLVEACKLDS